MKIEERIEKYLSEEKVELYPMGSGKYAGQFAIKKGDKIYDPYTKKWITMKSLVYMDDWAGLAMSKRDAGDIVKGQGWA